VAADVGAGRTRQLSGFTGGRYSVVRLFENKRFRKIEAHATVDFTMTAVARNYASESLRRPLESEKPIANECTYKK
jgi:hypothetical protein